MQFKNHYISIELLFIKTQINHEFENKFVCNYRNERYPITGKNNSS